MKVRSVRIGDFCIGDKDMVLIAGPCVIESLGICQECCRFLKDITSSLGIRYIFKASFDKANRSSVKSFRGLGLKKGLSILSRIKEKFSVPLLSDVHCRTDVREAGKVLDVLQIPAFLCRQTDLVLEAASTGKPLNIKKGQFLSPWEMRFVVEKAASRGNRNLMLTERGTSFGYNNLVVDMRSLKIMRSLGYPVVFDATHSVQRPGAGRTASLGDREFVLPLARAAVAFSCDGLFLEVHPRPSRALSDASNMLSFALVEKVLKEVKSIWDLVRER